MIDLAKLYPSMVESAAEERPPTAADVAAEAQLRKQYPSMYPDPPPTGGSLLDRMYPSMVEHVDPFVDPGNDPIAIKHELVRMMNDESGVAMIKETIDCDPAHASVWLERLGLGIIPSSGRWCACRTGTPACGPSGEHHPWPSGHRCRPARPVFRGVGAGGRRRRRPGRRPAAALGEVVHGARPRLALLPDGSQQFQVDATKVWRLAESLGVAVPDRFAAS